MGFIKKLWDLLWSPLAWFVSLWGLLFKLIGWAVNQLTTSLFSWMSENVLNLGDMPEIDALGHFLLDHLALDVLGQTLVTILAVRLATRLAHASVVPIRVLLDLL